MGDPAHSVAGARPGLGRGWITGDLGVGVEAVLIVIERGLADDEGTPELVPEYPSGLYSIQALWTQASHAWRQAPMYMPESLKLEP